MVNAQITKSKNTAVTNQSKTETTSTDLPLAGAILKSNKAITKNEAAHLAEHSIEVQLPFLQSVGKNFTIVPLLCGNVDPAELANAIMDEIGERTVVIASSDLSHYNQYDRAVKIDRIANEAVPALDIARFEKEGDACGKTAILTLMHIAKRKKWTGKLLDYRNSGDTAGPKSEVVGYGCYAFSEPERSKTGEK